MTLKTGLYGRKALEAMLVVLEFARAKTIACFQVEEDARIQEEIRLDFGYVPCALLDEATASLEYDNEVVVNTHSDATLSRELLAKCLRQVYLALEWFRLDAKLMFCSPKMMKRVLHDSRENETSVELYSRLVEKTLSSNVLATHTLSFLDRDRLISKNDIGLFADMIDYNKSNTEEQVDPFVQEQRRLIYHRLIVLYNTLSREKFPELWEMVEISRDVNWYEFLMSIGRRDAFEKFIDMSLEDSYFDGVSTEFVTEVKRQMKTVLDSSEFEEFSQLLDAVRVDDWLLMHLFSMRFEEI